MPHRVWTIIRIRGDRYHDVPTERDALKTPREDLLLMKPKREKRHAIPPRSWQKELLVRLVEVQVLETMRKNTFFEWYVVSGAKLEAMEIRRKATLCNPCVINTPKFQGCETRRDHIWRYRLVEISVKLQVCELRRKDTFFERLVVHIPEMELFESCRERCQWLVVGVSEL
jgi:hypothetical protein